ncbi:hypothetical protein FA95DRAFT_1490649 [Auriscalpium vulgare]|uniref:Uncharacterized protein n=1 Tax=Auriscalpium vulgare TaxID=40419 RepID=A0ACB8RWP2_9AGAM|nr:hypothetical protein FA95DRAFT_1490649 [Auriscalpium vulgare]
MTTTATVTDLLDPASSAYKKARRQHFKTTKNRTHPDADWTPFRAAEKKYKARFPPPDLSDVLDLALADAAREQEVEAGVWRGRADAADVREGGAGCKAYVVPSIPGLVILPGFLTATKQRELVRYCLREHARHPNETNLDTHYLLPPEGLWNADPTLLISPRAPPDPSTSTSPGPRQLIANTPASPTTFHTLAATPKPPAVPSPTVPSLAARALLPRLRWANIGWFYHWGTKQYDFARGREPVGGVLREVCRDAVRSVPWGEVFREGETQSGWGKAGPDWGTWEESYEPDAGIVNFYQAKDTLMGHVDRSEVCATSPLVSISLGNAAIFLIGGLTRNVEPVPILLRSGDVVIMSGPACRRAYHGVPRILENTLPSHLAHSDEEADDWTPFATYLENARINVNVRQVFPKGFEPGLSTATPSTL